MQGNGQAISCILLCRTCCPLLGLTPPIMHIRMRVSVLQEVGRRLSSALTPAARACLPWTWTAPSRYGITCSCHQMLQSGGADRSQHVRDKAVPASDTEARQGAGRHLGRDAPQRLALQVQGCDHQHQVSCSLGPRSVRVCRLRPARQPNPSQTPRGVLQLPWQGVWHCFSCPAAGAAQGTRALPGS